MNATPSFDYIIVGAGSAGCVLASRLSENPKHRVLLIEAGPKDRTPWIHIPAGFSRMFLNQKYNWGYMSAPEPGLDNRPIYSPRGKTLGGTSAINGMMYVRGHAADYDGWRQMGNDGWSYDDVLPYFMKSEDNSRGSDAFHGTGGEMGVSDQVEVHPISERFVEAAVNTGLPATDDFNGASQDGAGLTQVTVKDGVRESTARAFLRPARNRPNLEIWTEVLTHKVVLDGKRATGVEISRGGEQSVVQVRKEIILSAGTYNSPQLLQLSGISAGAHLQSLGLPVLHDLKGVGENMHDHLYVNTMHKTSRSQSVNDDIKGLGIVPHVLRYLINRKGLLTIPVSQACAFIRALPGADRPDLQIAFRPITFEVGPKGAQITDYPGVTASCCRLRPQSRGHVKITSADPKTPPEILHNYLVDPSDQQAALLGLKWMREAFGTSPLKELSEEEVVPGINRQSDDDLLAYARETSNPVYHPVGSCKMGQDDRAVVDEKLRVHGIDGLRVVDASIMPVISSGNTNGPTIMIAEKGADLIKSAA